MLLYHSQFNLLIVFFSIFTQNAATGGTLVAGFTNLNITGNNLFEKNTGPSLRVSRKLIRCGIKIIITGAGCRLNDSCNW